LIALAVVLILHGLYGPDLAPKNLATLVTWVHYRGLLVLILLVAGNFFCLACPFMLPRDLARRFFRPLWNWPRPLRNKWAGVALFVLLLFTYEEFNLWGEPRWTALLIAGYFVAALAVDAVFKHASFCKWLCPIGQFNFVASTVSPLEIRVRDADVCGECRTKDCIRGRSEPATSGHGRLGLPLVSQRGCELALFQPMKSGNLDCTFCLDCVHACPHDNVGLVSRLPGSELWTDSQRSGIGQPHARKDMAALVLVFTFGALLNAFGMTSPVYAVEAWLSRISGITQRAPILATLFVAGLVVEPAVLLGLAAMATRGLTGSTKGILSTATRYAFSLVPLGFGIWLAHYLFHFLTGVLTVIPVTQAAADDLGWSILGEPNWNLAGLRVAAVYPLETGFLTLGLFGSWIVAIRLARSDCRQAPWRAHLPWLVLHTLLWASAVWLLAQPMEMRGTFLGG
jgi:polyferredoxin